MRTQTPLVRALLEIDRVIDGLVDSPSESKDARDHLYRLTVLLVTRGHLLNTPPAIVAEARTTFASMIHLDTPLPQGWEAIREGCREYADHAMAEQQVQWHDRCPS